STTPSASAWTWSRTRPSGASPPNAWRCRPSTPPVRKTSPTLPAQPPPSWPPNKPAHGAGLGLPGKWGRRWLIASQLTTSVPIFPSAAETAAALAEGVGVGVVLAAGTLGQADLERQAVARVGLAQRLLELDLAFLVEPVQRLVEGLHAVLQRLVHGVLDLVHLAAADQVADHRRVDQHLHGRQALAVRPDPQASGELRLQVHGQVHQHVLVRRLREEVEDALQGLVGVVGVQ